MIDEARKKGLRIEIIPSKLVWTKKPGKKGGRKKVRWVVRGNFESKDPNEETFSSGADAAAFRIMVWTASKLQWEASTLDVKTAFLNAKMAAKEDQELPVRCVLSPRALTWMCGCGYKCLCSLQHLYHNLYLVCSG